jgi:hypothetical protein
MSLFTGDEAQLQKILDEAIDRLNLPALIVQLALPALVEQVQTAISDELGKIQKTIAESESVSIDDLHLLLDRLNGTTAGVSATIIFSVPPRAAPAATKGKTQ